MSAYTFRASGTVASNNNSAALSPGAPAGVAVGDLLLLFAIHRSASATLTTPTGWDLLYSLDTPNCISVFARIADGQADDTPSSLDWSGTGGCMAWIEARHGDVYDGALSGLIIDGPDSTAAVQAHPVLPALTVTGNDRLVILMSTKNKTSTSDDSAAITHANYNVRTQGFLDGVASGLAVASADLQQTTATNFDGTDFVIDGTEESLTSTGIAFSIQTATAIPPKLIVARSNIRLN